MFPFLTVLLLSLLASTWVSSIWRLSSHLLCGLLTIWSTFEWYSSEEDWRGKIEIEIKNTDSCCLILQVFLDKITESAVLCLYLGDDQHHSYQVGTRQERSHFMVRKCWDCQCILNPGLTLLNPQPYSSKHSSSGFIVLDLFSYLFCLVFPVGLLCSDIYQPRRTTDLSSAKDISKVLYNWCPIGYARPDSALQGRTQKPRYHQPSPRNLCLKQIQVEWDIAQESEDWIFIWLSKLLLYIPYPILK